ncbi:MAG: glycosyltransferase family 4 protein [Gammaproteobacteria bacterium]|nr:glycosyltransferase family 4 protein [Gammaproteobacteria bacterium]
MKPTLLVHIDYGSQGSAGLYIERLLRAPCPIKDVVAFVHRGYTGESAGAEVHRVFGRHTSVFPRGPLQSIYKWLDLYWCFFSIWIQLRRKSKTYRIVSVVSLFQSFRAYGWLFQRLRTFGQLIVIVHDAVEHRHRYPWFVMSPRENLLRHADRLVTHSHDAIRHLEVYRKDISVMPFPPMRPFPIENCSAGHAGQIKFLFVGHIKPEKGLERLIRVWRGLPETVLRRCSLTIAGSLPSGHSIDFTRLEKTSLETGFLEEDRFLQLIDEADCLIFPYVGGTSSGVYSISCSMGKASVVSSLPVFSGSPFYPASIPFDDDQELATVIVRIVQRPEILAEKQRQTQAIWGRVDSDFDAFFERSNPFIPAEMADV